ncbi:hypothetical protein [Xanthomonas sp. SHU 199]|nr:hypothetical protein [Xanthomonas sp. SHU 199]
MLDTSLGIRPAHGRDALVMAAGRIAEDTDRTPGQPRSFRHT